MLDFNQNQRFANVSMGSETFSGREETTGELIKLPDNSFIFSEGELPKGIYQVKSGAVKLVIRRPYSRGRTATPDFVVKVVGPGEYFGYTALLQKGKHSYYAKTIRPSEIVIHSPAPILGVLSGPSSVVKDLLLQSLKDLEQIENTVQTQYLASVQERIAHQILVLADRFGVKTDKGVALSLRLTRNELAQLASTINESLSRHLTEFKTEGLIDLPGKDIVILNRSGLASRAGWADPSAAPKPASGGVHHQSHFTHHSPEEKSSV